MTVTKPSPAFRRMLSTANRGEVLVPILQAALFDPSFKAFTVRVDGFVARPPDGWFHPSTHPVAGERALYYYLTEPDRMINPIRDPHSVMAVTQGKFWHDFIQGVLLEAKALKRNPKPGRGMNAAEWPWKHEKTRSRGHTDGLTMDEEVFEFKTMGKNRLDRFPVGGPEDPDVLAYLRRIMPDYYAQGQEYMRLSGRRRWRAVILGMEYPYPMREITMTYDPFYADQIVQKYERVLQAVADQRPPSFCCGGGAAAKECPARGICEMGSPG